MGGVGADDDGTRPAHANVGCTDGPLIAGSETRLHGLAGKTPQVTNIVSNSVRSYRSVENGCLGNGVLGNQYVCVCFMKNGRTWFLEGHLWKFKL